MTIRKEQVEQLAKTGVRLMRKLLFVEAAEVLRAALELNPGDEKTREFLERSTRFANNNNDRPVDFLIVGTQKGGTTALNQFLRNHPDVCTAAFTKELHYFDAGVPSSKHKNYHRCFFPEARHKQVGEATPSYMFAQGALEQIKLYRPTIKLIVLLRDPIERAHSSWTMRWEKRPRPFDMKRCLREYQQEKEIRMGHTLARGLYIPQLDRIYQMFPREQILLLRSEDLKAQHDQTLHLTAKFLDIGGFPPSSEREFNARMRLTKLSEETYIELKAFYQDDVRSLQDKYGMDTSAWMSEFS